MFPRGSQGYSLIELVTVLVLLGILAGIAAPSLQRSVELIRARGVLNQFVSDLFYARMLAVREGETVRLELVAGSGDCVERYEVRPASAARPLLTRSTGDLPGVCLEHTGGGVIEFNARGMVKPPGRSVYLEHGAGADTVTVSVPGRIRRTY